MYIRRRMGRRVRLLFLLFIVTAIYYYLPLFDVDRFFSEKLISEAKEPVVTAPEKKIPQRIGEKITYDVMLGKMRLGEAEYHYVQETDVNGRPAYMITFETKAVKFRDLETIYCDRESFLPLVIERKVTQLVKPEKIREVYDQVNYILRITRKRFTVEETVIRKESPIHNSILLPFVVRNSPKLDIGWSFKANLPQREYLITLASVEKVEVPAGKFEAYYFESDPKQIRIWISTDENRIPLKIEGTGSIGYKLVMSSYSPAGKPAGK